MLHQAVFNTSEVCFYYGVRHAVMSPGSRNAPLIISFARNDKIKKWIIPDERSAGFIALGMAQKLKQPVVLCCTSGTALLNYAPAIAEAFYREIPLIVLSADRPIELIDQRDGQTIRQYEALRNHVKSSTQLPLVNVESDEREYLEKLTNALEKSLVLPSGPVHINIPFKEPFYPTEDQELKFDFKASEADFSQSNAPLSYPEKKEFDGKRVLILVGQTSKDFVLNDELLKANSLVPILKSPLNNLEITGIEHTDLFLDDQEDLVPDILITSGLSVLSKKVKDFLRKNKPEKHYHFDPAGVEVDTYETNPQIIKSSLSGFLAKTKFDNVDVGYIKSWMMLSNSTKSSLASFMPLLDFSESKAFYQVLGSLPSDIELHLSNSMPVRFADIFGVNQKIETWCNRGTSGIDGCTSTSLGTSLVSDNLNLLLTGDLSFLYDRNAFFHNYTASNFRIIVFNNSGGGIFRLIEGPGKLPELEEYFETRHNRTAKYICKENRMEYFTACNSREIEMCIENFYKKSDSIKLLEVFTDPETNERVFRKLKQHIHEQINL